MLTSPTFDDVVWLDCETTGTDTQTDRIVELCLRKSGAVVTWRFNPTIPIPAEATAVHGITDADVADCPVFSQVAHKVWAQLDGQPIGGFNHKRFDLPLLVAEFERAKCAVPAFESVPLVDVYQIYAHLNPRSLEACVCQYLRREHEGAHGAEADTEVLPLVLERIIAAHDVPQSIGELGALCDELGPYLTAVDEWFDRSGAAPVFRRGMHKGLTLDAVRRKDRGYLNWMAREEGIERAVKEFVS